MLSRKYALLAGLTLAVLAIDHLTKYTVLAELTTALDGDITVSAKLSRYFSDAPSVGFDGFHYRQKRSITLSENFFRLRYAENPGAAFGLFRNLPEHLRGPLFHVVSLGAVILIGFFYTKLTGQDPQEKWALWGLPLVLGGAIGNYIDRLARGFVIDFLEAHWFDKMAWPSFNVADTAICVGVGLLVVDSFVRKETKARLEVKAT